MPPSSVFTTINPSKVQPLPKVQLKLDPLAYRSASQGPLMPEELTPATPGDYDEIDSVIERAVRSPDSFCRLGGRSASLAAPRAKGERGVRKRRWGLLGASRSPPAPAAGV